MKLDRFKKIISPEVGAKVAGHATNMVSVRNDIDRNGYGWNRNSAWNHFSTEKTSAVLALLLGDDWLHDADETNVPGRMNLKTAGGATAFEFRTGNLTGGEAET